MASSFEAGVRRAPLELEPWLRYVAWAETHGDAAAVRERCGRALLGVEAYRNDERYVRVWLAVASHAEEEDPAWVFELLDEHEIGHDLALFWIAWAFVAEKTERFKDADTIYARGAHADAKPKDLLSRRRREFERRMKRHFITATEKATTTKRPPLRAIDTENTTTRRPLHPLDHTSAKKKEDQSTAKKAISRRLVFSTAKREQPSAAVATTTLKAADQDDLTINSALAAKEIDSLFYDDNRTANYDDASMLAGDKHQHHHDDDDDDDVITVPPSPQPSSTAFAIFQDD
ncbi:hypothetical protein CTAYLR_008022 [Chrysophaeum taylorii]|uniref:BUB1 N-terminal domain-containing protein n=1 Tax=Chrysophaeum taylorii TaxID=2483200 RepID=A0AAD7XIB7_9STRA|nr:hypothetical protein CTAYLR_008022 [Chrysophaeum taylorii]